MSNIIKVTPLKCPDDLCEGDLILIGTDGECIYLTCSTCQRMVFYELDYLRLVGPTKGGGNGD